MIHGVIFDMDGLMFDTERMWDTFWPPVCDRLGLPHPPPQFYPSGRGLAGATLGVPIAECLVLEDSHNGVRAGHAAGAVTVMVPDLMPVTDEMRDLYSACCENLLQVRDMLAAGEL